MNRISIEGRLASDGTEWGRVGLAGDSDSIRNSVESAGMGKEGDLDGESLGEEETGGGGQFIWKESPALFRWSNEIKKSKRQI